MRQSTYTILGSLLRAILPTLGVLMALTIWSAPSAFATTLLNRFDKVSNPTTGSAAHHLIGFGYNNTTSPVGSLSIEFCSNDPIPASSCTPPTGFDASGANLITQTGETGFSIDPSSTANHILLTRSAAVPAGGAARYEFSSIVNPSVAGTYFVRLQTFSSTDGSGVAIEVGGIALSSQAPINVSAEVPPYLNFCVGVTIASFDCSTINSYFVDLGEFSVSDTKNGSTQMVASTNAALGYSITVAGTTLTAGNNIIAALTSPTPSQTGAAQFGINLRSNSQPTVGANPVGAGTATPTADYNIPDRFKFQNGDVVASANNSQNYRKYTVSYIANIPSDQAAGVYVTTMTFICLANF